MNDWKSRLANEKLGITGPFGYILYYNKVIFRFDL